VAFALSNLQPSQPKPSSLLGPAVAYTPIVVFAGAGKKSAETQIAAARGKLKGKARTASAETNQLAAAGPPGANPTAAVAASSGSRLRDTFGPIPSAPPWMSFAPTAQAAAAPAPLTATPTPVQIAVVPLPRPRPKLATRKPRVR
jgi:hypothetical protein